MSGTLNYWAFEKEQLERALAKSDVPDAGKDLIRTFLNSQAAQSVGIMKVYTIEGEKNAHR